MVRSRGNALVSGCGLALTGERHDVLLQPDRQLRKSEGVGLEQVHEVRVSFQAIAVDGPAIEPEEHVRGCKRCPLVAVDEGMVHREAFHEGGGFLYEGVIVANLRAHNGGGQSAFVSNAMCAAKKIDQGLMQGNDFLDGWVGVGRWASSS